jgi:hypothetical protein
LRRASRNARQAHHRREGAGISDSKQSADDVAIVEQLNLDYDNADQGSDVKWFDEFLADDFIVRTPGSTGAARWSTR